MKKDISLERLKNETLWSTGKNSLPQDYDTIRLSFAEWICALVKGAALLALAAYVFYRSALAFILCSPALLLYLKRERKKRAEHHKEELVIQFREMMHALIAGLQAGYSIENAFLHATEDMRLLFGKNALITRELMHLNRELRNNVNLEDVLDSWAGRAKVPDIRDFAEVFRIAKRSGGDLPGILHNTAELISDRIEVQREIGTQIAAKKMEQGIMDLVPFGIILYIDATSPGFFDSLYGNPFGVILMSVLLGVYLAAYLLAEKILKIAY